MAQPDFPAPGSPANEVPKKKSKWGLCLIISAVVLVISIPIVAILVAIGLPAMMIALDRAKKSNDTQNIRMLGIALMAEAAASDSQTYPILRDKDNIARTSTEAFAYLLDKKAIPTPDLVFSPGKGKVKLTGAGTLTSNNVGYNYIKAYKDGKEQGVEMAADDSTPLLWSSGNAPLIIKDGACPLELLDTGIWKKSGSTVYFKGNNASFKKTTGGDKINNFVPPHFNTGGVRYTELAP